MGLSITRVSSRFCLYSTDICVLVHRLYLLGCRLVRGLRSPSRVGDPQQRELIEMDLLTRSGTVTVVSVGVVVTPGPVKVGINPEYLSGSTSF